MKELRNTIKEVLPELISIWNNEKLPLLETVWEQSFNDYFTGRQTQEKLKWWLLFWMSSFHDW